MKVGFSVDQTSDYFIVRPSIRIRAYDVIKYLCEHDVDAELYKSDQHYDVVVFLKSFHQKHLSIAKELKKKGTKIVYDLGVNYIELTGGAETYVTKEQTNYVLSMLNMADAVSVVSSKLVEVYSKVHPNVVLIHDVVAEPRFFDVKKDHVGRSLKEVSSDTLKIMDCGVASKAREVLLIKNVLLKLAKTYGIEMLYICEKDPELDFLPYTAIKYCHRNIHNQLLLGDIKIAPRDLTNSYNWGHSMLKVAMPMAVGIPVVASPVPSYIGNVRLICDNEKQWYGDLEMLISDRELRGAYGYEGRKAIQDHFTMENAGPLYKQLYESLL
jgi:hypothetical protein